MRLFLGEKAMAGLRRQRSDCRSTTILAVRRGGVVAVGGDGQVTMADTVLKHHASKIRRLYHDQVIVGFAGSAGDAFALLDRLSGKLEQYQGHLLRSAHELAKEWRTDRMLRPLQSLMVAVDKKYILLISGSGEVIEPDDGVIGIGSGGALATAAARALIQNTNLEAEAIVDKSLRIAADICVFTNQQIRIEKLSE
jgi:ATP-dependent HslUV protease subunit HslV